MNPWFFFLSLICVALFAAEAVARALPNKSGYRRWRARGLNVLFRNDFGQSFVIPRLRESFGAKNAVDTDISDHLSELFFDVVNAAPRLIVELGTRGGESTRVLLAAAEGLGARVLSVDNAECSQIELPSGLAPRWTFVKSDDVSFGKDSFAPWCAEQGLAPQADLIFLDTSHQYQHTVAELAVWLPLLKVGGTILFHDTNMRAWMYRRLDNSLGVGAYNDRGVIRAIEEVVGRTYDENTSFCDLTDHYLIRHRPHCNGYTLMKRLR